MVIISLLLINYMKQMKLGAEIWKMEWILICKGICICSYIDQHFINLCL